MATFDLVRSITSNEMKARGGGARRQNSRVPAVPRPLEGSARAVQELVEGGSNAEWGGGL